MTINNAGPIRYTNGPGAVDTLNEVLERLEAICDSYEDVAKLNKAIDNLLREHGVFAGEVYALT